jgi:DNA-binding SARP family transcriptional activator
VSELVEFGVLGPLVVRCGGVVVPLRRGRQRALLAALLVEANRVVPVGGIAEVLWGAAAPPSAPVAIRNYVRRLREALGEAGRGRVVTQPRGYLIGVGEGELDLARFEGLLGLARVAVREDRWEVAAERAQAALGLWRGEPLADVESEVLAVREVPRLAELRLQAAEISIDASLRLGGHAGVVAELQRLVAAHPLREHLHALLMLALYRCGRQADALAAFRRVRRVLVEELAAEPGAELQVLHRQMLAADPVLDLPGAAAEAGGWPERASAAVGGGVAAGVPPRQLPAAAGGFTGRCGELTALTEMADGAGGVGGGTVMISAISGMAGVGKTALAVYWAHQVAERFPDGQLYVNLRGFGPAGAPVTPFQAIRGFLGALGVAPGQIPAGADDQAGLYRSVLASRRMLIVLDNARDEEQVRPLLPGSSGIVVVVTSRRQLAGLAATDGARLLSLDVLPDDEARRLLAARLGARRGAGELAEIAGLCGCLPLALAIAAARAEARPGLPLAALAAELRDAGARLDALDAGDPAASIRAVFSWSVRQLSAEAARMFRLLGLHPGPGITASAAASLAGCSLPAARGAVAELARAHLLTECIPGRYACHDLLHAYAADQAASTEPEPERAAATGRLLDHYLHTACAAARLLNPTREPVTLAPARPGVTPQRLSGYQQAQDWFETEHPVLLGAVTLAAASGFGCHAWQLPWAMTDYLDRCGHWHDHAAIQRTALDAATSLGDTAGQAAARLLFAQACARSSDYDQARAHLADCLTLCRSLADTVGEARTELTLCWVGDHQGRHGDALSHAEHALRLFQAIGDTAGQATALNNIGYCHTHLGDPRRGREFARKALALHRETGNQHGQAHTWDTLGHAEHHLGHLTQATACFQNAISLFQELGDRFSEAETLTHLGDTNAAASNPRQATHAWQQALTILNDLHHPYATHIHAKLTTAATDHPAPAAAQGLPA